MANFVIFGGKGMVGKAWQRQLATVTGVSVVAPTQQEAEVTDLNSVKQYLAAHPAEVVVNCAVEVNVDQCEATPEQALAVNTLGAENIVRAALANGQHPVIIQPSSNYVFGDELTPHTESDEPCPLNMYGWSKFLAERLVAHTATQAGLKFFIARTGWLYSPDKITFLDKVANDLLQNIPVTAVADQRGVLIAADDFVRGCLYLWQNIATEPSGIYHLVPTDEPAQTRLEIVRWCATVLGRSLAEIVAAPGQAVLAARRPQGAIIINTKLPGVMPAWHAAAENYLRKKYLSE